MHKPNEVISNIASCACIGIWTSLCDFLAYDERLQMSPSAGSAINTKREITVGLFYKRLFHTSTSIIY